MSLADAENCLSKYNSDAMFSMALRSGSREENAKTAQESGFYFTPAEWSEVVGAGTAFKTYYRAGCTFPNECK